jgi:hypothetical protein
MELLSMTYALSIAAREIFSVWIHRVIVILRQRAGLPAFMPLSKIPRHVLLAVEAECCPRSVEDSARFILSLGVEKVTVCFDDTIEVTSESIRHIRTCDNGKSSIVEKMKHGDPVLNSSHPDLLLIYSDSIFTTTAIKIPKCVDFNLIYYSEIIPIFSLNFSDVFYSISLFQSKSQRYGK